jgi:hypothetical protein
MFKYKNKICENKKTAFALFLFVPKKKLSIFKKPNKKLLKYLRNETDYRLNKKELGRKIKKLNYQIINKGKFFGKHVIYGSFEEAKQKMYEQLVKYCINDNEKIYVHIGESNAVIVKINFPLDQLKDIDKSIVYKFNDEVIDLSNFPKFLRKFQQPQKNTSQDGWMSVSDEPNLIKCILNSGVIEEIGRKIFSKKYSPKIYENPVKYSGVEIEKSKCKLCIIL